IVVAGWSSGSGGHHQLALVRYTADGRVDPGFGDHGRVLTTFGALPDGRPSDGEANAIAIQPDGRIVVGGSTTAPNGDDNFALARYTPEGLIDTEFGHNTLRPGRVLTDFRGFKDEIRAIALQPDGKIVVAGRSNAPNGAGPAAANPAGQGDLKAQRQV